MIAMARVLVVDGDSASRIDLATMLGREGHEIEMASGAASGVVLARSSQPDLVVLETLLPDGRGADVCRALRRDETTRRALILVVSKDASEDGRVAAFEAGADDYVTKPYSARELLLRVNALLRRRRAGATPRVLAAGPMRIDAAARRVLVNGHPVDLSRREFDVLLRLAERRGRVQTREALLRDVWEEDTDSGRVVDTTMKRLRKKLGAAADLIRTVRGVGYQLVHDEDEDAA